MGAFKETPMDKPTPESLVPTPIDYRGVSIDSKRTPINTIQTAITGRRYIVDYYLQNLGRDDEYSGNRRNASSVYQSLKLIKNYELKVTDPLPFNPSSNSTNNESEVVGRTNIYPSFVPNPGDEFIATLRDGRRGVFTVLEPITPLSIYSQTAYTFDFKLKEFLTQKYEDDLNRKVSQVYLFIRDNLDTGLNPIITEEAYIDYQKLIAHRDSMPTLYTNRFFNNEFRTLIIPDQQYPIYDPFHVQFCSAIFGSVKHGIFNSVGLLSITDNLQFTISTIHDLLLEFKECSFNDIQMKFKVISRFSFYNNPALMGTRYIPTDYLVFLPHNAPEYNLGWLGFGGSDGCGCGRPNIDQYIKLEQGKWPEYQFPSYLDEGWSEDTIPTICTNENALGMPDYKRVWSDGYYIFSRDFYSKRPGKYSLVEKLLWDVLTEEMVQPKDLIRLLDESTYWPSLERFYYQPFLYAMIHYAMRGLE